MGSLYGLIIHDRKNQPDFEEVTLIKSKTDTIFLDDDAHKF